MHSQTKFLPRQQYFVFRFEDSLRKYEPAPRKKVKLTQQECNHCYKRRISQSKESRISRLCATRKKYHLQSREGASSFSKMKENSIDKKNILVSDFMSDTWEDQNEEIKLDKILKSEKSSNKKKFLKQSSAVHKENELRQEIEVIQKFDEVEYYENMKSVQRRETLIKEEIKEKMEREEQMIKEELLMSEQRRNDRIRDIDFHIKMVSELHQNFLLDHRMSSSWRSVQENSDEQFIKEQMEEEEQIMARNFLQNDCGEISEMPEINYSPEKSHSDYVRRDPTDQINEFQEEVPQRWETDKYSLKSPQKECRCQKIQSEMEQFQSIDELLKEGPPLSIFPKSQPKTKNKRLQSFIDSNSDYSQSRIRIKASNCTLALSARILYKLYPVYTHNPSAFTIKIVQRYPQLQSQDIQKLQYCLQEKFRKQKEEGSDLIQQENEQNQN